MSKNNTTVRSTPARVAKGRTPRLWAIGGSHAGTVWELSERKYVIGKAQEAEIRLSDSGVSRRHAKIVCASDGQFSIVDLESTNGTFVDGERVEVATLREGARINVGPDAQLCFGLEAPAAGLEPPPAGPRKPIDNPLTERELEVARLASRGLTNREIAAQLGIKAKTVSSHLDNIYVRLTITSRVALTRWLIGAGLERVD